MRGEVRTPRIRLLAWGDEVPGVIAGDIWANNHLAGDRFRVRLAAAAGGLAALDQPDVRLELQVGLGGDWTRMVVGEADSVSLDRCRDCWTSKGATWRR